MARRKAPAVAPVASRYPSPPAELARNVVVDWVAPGEITRYGIGDDGASAGDDPRVAVLTAVRVRAWSLRSAAVRAWLRANGIPREDHREVLPARGFPSFEGQAAAYLQAAGFTARELEAVANRWVHPIGDTSTTRQRKEQR